MCKRRNITCATSSYWIHQLKPGRFYHSLFVWAILPDRLNSADLTIQGSSLFSICQQCRETCLPALNYLSNLWRQLKIIHLLRNYHRFHLTKSGTLWKTDDRDSGAWPVGFLQKCSANRRKYLLDQCAQMCTNLRQRTFFLSGNLYCFTHQNFWNRKEM